MKCSPSNCNENFDMPDNSKSAIVKGIERVKIKTINEFIDY